MAPLERAGTHLGDGDLCWMDDLLPCKPQGPPLLALQRQAMLVLEVDLSKTKKEMSWSLEHHMAMPVTGGRGCPGQMPSPSPPVNPPAHATLTTSHSPSSSQRLGRWAAGHTSARAAPPSAVRKACHRSPDGVLALGWPCSHRRQRCRPPAAAPQTAPAGTGRRQRCP